MNQITSRALALASMPHMADRMSPRKSRSVTQPAAPRTFSELEEWIEFLSSARALTEQLDNTNVVHPQPRTNDLKAPADEARVRGHVDHIIYELANILAKELGIHFEFEEGGNGRGLSFTDGVVLDRSQPANQDNPSGRIFAVGEIKGPWQMTVQQGMSYIDAVRSGDEHLMQVLQQLFGDMVTEEVVAGFLTNYNQTIFFRRTSNPKCKKLFVSPVIHYNESPLQAFLYFIHFVHENRGEKTLLPRNKVEVTPPSGYILKLPVRRHCGTWSGRTTSIPNPVIRVKAKSRTGKRLRAEQADITFEVDTQQLQVDLSRIEVLPRFSFEDLGISSKCIGEGRHGKVLDGVIQDIPVAIKYYDLRKSSAGEAFDKERHVYERLKNQQGISVPIVLCIGTIEHTNWPIIAMSKGGTCLKKVLEDGLSSKEAGRLKKSIKKSLSYIHKAGVLHNDLTLDNILIQDGEAKLIDFEYSIICEENTSFKLELLEVDKLLL